MLVPIADNGVGAVLDQVKIVGDDLLHGAAEAIEVCLLPGAELARLGFSQVLQLVFGGIVNLVPQLLERRGDSQTPAFAFVRRVLNGACEVEKHGDRRLSAIRLVASTLKQIAVSSWQIAISH